LKGLDNWLENKVKTLEEKLSNFKTDFENLEIIYKNSFCNDIKNCENCTTLQQKVEYYKNLKQVFERRSKSQSFS